ncbi:PHP domain-containing protein [Chloroflexota bacterium]
MHENFVKIDLHIHTPASTCYKASKEPSEIINILRKAKQLDLKIISFTDHNSIEGYKMMISIKEGLTQEVNTLSEISDSEQAKERLCRAKDDLSLFDDILILPGVEFEVRNGIHLLVIFNDNTKISDIEELLFNGGYRAQDLGVEEPLIQSSWDIFAFFEETEKYECIVIDAHTDQNKGILNTIPRGNTRARCFSAPQLSAACYSSEEQKDKLMSVLTTAKEYSRTTPPAFLKFSDAHKPEDVGSKLSWINIENLSFESLKTAFANPSEMISTEEPSTSRILDDLIKLENTFGVTDLNAETENRFKCLVCAYLTQMEVIFSSGLLKIRIKSGYP